MGVLLEPVGRELLAGAARADGAAGDGHGGRGGARGARGLERRRGAGQRRHAVAPEGVREGAGDGRDGPGAADARRRVGRAVPRRGRTRLAPLPGAENNNKPGVKLPGLLTVGGEKKPFTVLESVIRQTSAYAKVRGGRCSVFWGDQIFVPSVALSGGDHPADILAALRPMPSKEEWRARCTSTG